MIECPSCGREHRPGTLFCGECGAYLPTGGDSKDRSCSDEAPAAGLDRDSGGIAQTRERANANLLLHLRVVSTGRQILLAPGEDIQFGRLDADNDISPDVDLTSDGGLEGGVSRAHCRVFQSEGHFRVEDLSSANGTFLEGRRLTPHVPRILRDGDRLRLGRVVLRVSISE